MATTKIEKAIVSPSDSFFFDTNVWLFLFGPIADTDKWKQAKYSSILATIVSRNAGLFISSLIIAEYINRVLRIEFKNWKTKTGNVNANYKTDFRNTADYLFAKDDAIKQVGEILKVSTRTPDSFNSIDINELFMHIDENCDFNDAYLASLCERGGHSLVTDDRDFEKSFPDLSIITA